MPLPTEFDLISYQYHELKTFILLILHNPKEKNLRVSHQKIEGAMAMSRQLWWDPGQFSQMIHASHSQGLLEIAQSGSWKDRVWSSFSQPCVLMFCIWGHVLLGVSGLKDFLCECCWWLQQVGAQPLCTFSLSMCQVSKKWLYKVLMTFLEGVLCLLLGYILLNVLFTITVYFYSCIHKVLWAFFHHRL